MSDSAKTWIVPFRSRHFLSARRKSSLLDVPSVGSRPFLYFPQELSAFHYNPLCASPNDVYSIQKAPIVGMLSVFLKKFLNRSKRKFYVYSLIEGSLNYLSNELNNALTVNNLIYK